MPRRVLDILVENFEIDDDVLVRTTHRLGFGDWMELTRLHRPELKDPNFAAARRCGAATRSTRSSSCVRHRDYMLHHPFDSFVSVETFLRAAVARPARRRDQDDALPHRPRLAARSICWRRRRRRASRWPCSSS